MIDPLVLFSAIIFFLVPLLIGRGWVQLLELVARQQRSATDDHVTGAEELGWYFGVGSVLVFGLALLTRYLILPFVSQPFLPVLLTMIGSILVVALIGNLFGLVRMGKRLLNWKTVQGVMLTGLLLGLAALSYTVLSWRSPYPLNWDLYEHQVLVREVTTGNFSFLTSQMSDSFGFNAYPPLFHTLMAVSQFLVEQTPTFVLQYWHVLGIFHMMWAVAAGYLLGEAMTGRKWVGILSALLNALVFESVLAFTNYLFLPQTMTAVLFIFLYAYLLKSFRQGQQLPWWKAILSVIILLLNHYVIGSLAVAIYLFTFVYLRFPQFCTRCMEKLPIVEVIMMAMVAAVLVSYQTNLGFINRGEAASYVFGLSDKFMNMRQMFGYGLLILLPLGLVVAAQHTKKTRLMALISLGFLAIFVSNFPYVLKFLVIGRYFFYALMALGIYTILERMRFMVFRLISVVIITTALALVLVLNSVLWKQWLRADSLFTHLDSDDIAAAEFLQQNYDPHSTLILSDPSTQYILEGLSGVNSPGGFAMADRLVFDDAFAQASPAETARLLTQMRDYVSAAPEKRLLIISGRTRLWHFAPVEQKKTFSYSIWTPQELTLTDHTQISQLAQSGRFQVVYQNPSLAILEIVQ